MDYFIFFGLTTANYMQGRNIYEGGLSGKVLLKMERSYEISLLQIYFPVSEHCKTALY